MADKNKIIDLAKKISAGGKILKAAEENLLSWLDEDFLPDWALNSIAELFEREAFEEINDRFFTTIAFGTGGMRGRTIGKVVTGIEMGTPGPQETPEYPAVGANNMNSFTVARATLGLFNYCKKHCDSQNLGAPRLVIAYDVRHFSKYFCELAASIWVKLGGTVKIFDGARSTPQLSFTVRHCHATAGIVITASHNPACDNGYKVYFSDGAQIISPNAEGIVSEVQNIQWRQVKNYMQINLNGVETISKDIENAYIKAIEACVIDDKVMSANKPKVVYTAVHGTGASLCPDIMRHFGLEPIFVDEQMVMDSRFPTVKQPNPEYSETLSMGIKKASEVGAECVMATDPDADRMGVAIRLKDGSMKLLTGNMIGSLFAEYRITRMKELGIIKDPAKCALVKTFVTSPLQDVIAKAHGLKCINTLTGFKWIGGKLDFYEKALLKVRPDLNYDKLSYAERTKLLQEYSTFFVFGGEESYGYLSTDFVRDKDANAAVITFCEMTAYLKSLGKTVDEYLDEIYLKYGYFYEDLLSLYREGAAGAKKIKSFLKSIDATPLKEVGGVKVKSSINFAKDKILDADGVQISKEEFFFYELENGYKFAIRASGTEPKIKFYGFAQEFVKSQDSLPKAKETAVSELKRLLGELEKIFDTAE